MSDVSEADAGLALAEHEAKLIHQLDPHNPLIRFFTDVYLGGESGWRKLRNEFTERFGKEGFRGEKCRGDDAIAAFYANYLIALKAERERLETQVKVA